MNAVARLGRARKAAIKRLHKVEGDLTEALHDAHEDGESVTILSRLSGLSRPTVYDRLTKRKEDA